MFTKHVKKTYSVLVALMLVFTCLGPAMALADDGVFTYVPGGRGASQQTPPVAADDGGNVGGNAGGQQAPATDVSTTPSDNTVAGSPAGEPGETVIVVDDAVEGDHPVYRVTFYNLSGVVVGWADVQEGAHLLELDGYPHVDGLVFQYWYDITNEIPEPYAFGTPVMAEINLVPYYTIDEGQGEQGGGAAMTDEEISSLINQILGGDAPQAQPGETTGLSGEKIDEIIGEIVGGIATEETFTVDGQEPGIPSAGINDLFGEVVGTGGETDNASTEEEKISTLISDILNAGEAGEQPEAGQPEAGEQSGEEIFTITESETPLAGPEGDPMVLVTCMFDGETIEVGTVVTLSAELINFPADAEVAYQWQNNASGEFVDVSGANDRTHTLVSDGVNSNCVWQVLTTY